MAKVPETEVEALRRYAGHATGARYQDAIDLVSELEERKDFTEAALEAWDELTDSLAIEQAADALDELHTKGLFDREKAEKLRQAHELITEVIDNTDVDALRTFVEAYENAAEALDTYSSTKDEEPYPGKRDVLEEEWQEATSAMDELADALETLES